MDPSRLGAIALVLGAIGVLMLAALAIMQAVLARRTGRTLADALDQKKEESDNEKNPTKETQRNAKEVKKKNE